LVNILSKSKYISQNIKDKFSQTDTTVLDKIINITSQKNIKCYLVGGAVRDIILGERPKDLDFVVEKEGETISSEIALAINGEVLNNSEFGTSKLSVKKSIYDIANSRSELYAHPGALPKVTKNSIDKDLWRRDFSINAIAFELTDNKYWQILDPTGGVADISNGTIRVLHDKSFVDDPTRIFRAVKYSIRFGFSINEKTKRLIGNSIKSNHINKVSGNRILSEISQILEEDNIKSNIQLLSSLGAFSSIHPNFKIEEALFDKLNQLNQSDKQDKSMLLSLLFSDIKSENIDEICQRLDINRKTSQILHDIQTIKQNINALSKNTIINSELMMLLDKLNIQALSSMQLISKNETLRKNLSNFIDNLRFIEPKITPNEIISIGVPPGPQIGNLLTDIRFAVADGILKTLDDEKRFVVNKMK